MNSESLGGEEQFHPEWEINYFKIKTSCFLLISNETMPFRYYKSIVSKGASVSKEFALFNWSSFG